MKSLPLKRADVNQSAEGYYVVFSNKHTEADTLDFDEEIAGKRIRTYLILTNFEPASRRPPPVSE